MPPTFLDQVEMPLSQPASQKIALHAIPAEASNLLFRPICVMRPERMVPPNSWLGHLPFAFWLIEASRPRILVELGTHSGNSYCGFLQAVKTLGESTACYAVDTWQGDPQAGLYGEDIYEDLKTYHDAHYQAFSRMIRAAFDEAVHHFVDGSIDLLHIDGYHTYEAVSHDFYTWLPKLSQRAVVLFHDINVREHDFGIWKFWDEIKDRYPSFGFLHSHGLGVLAVGPDAATGSVAWLTAKEEEQSSRTTVIRDFFGNLGQGLCESLAATTLKNERDSAVQELATTSRDLLFLNSEVENERWKLREAASRADWERQRADDARRRADDVERQIQEIRQSHSWRWTKPIRLASLLAHGRWDEAFRLLSAQFNRAPVPESGIPHIANRHTFAAAIRLPASPQPLVSIIVPVYGKIEYTLKCLRSLEEQKSNHAFEVIVVNDCSPDDTKELLTLVSNVILVNNPSNLGFIRSCHAGTDAARGEFLVFLNNDTIVCEKWLDTLIDTFADYPAAGLVGSKLIYPTGQLQEAGGIIWDDGSGWNFGRGNDPDNSRYNYLRDVDYCSGASIAIRRALFNQVGRFDERYLPAYYEDVDLAFAVRQAGFRVLYQPLSAVVHYEGISSGTDLESGAKAYQVVNQAKFLNKWRETLTDHGASGKNIRLASDRHAILHLLVIDACTPTPDQDAGSVATINILKILVGFGFRITFVPESDFARRDQYTEALQAMGIEFLCAPHFTNIEQLLKDRGSEFQAVMLVRALQAYSYIPLVRRHCPQAKIIFDTIDLHYLREEREAALFNDADRCRSAATTKARELEAVRGSDVTIVLSTVEKEILARETPEASVTIIPLVCEIPGRTAGFNERRGLIFIGGFRHLPNVDALLWFVRDVWPLVHQQLPEETFTIIGSNITPEIQALQGNGVHVAGFVEDLSPYMERARLTVAPLRYGAGLKGKVASSLSYGVPAVATSIAVEGMATAEDTMVLVADDPAGFADAVLRLHRDETLWNSISDNGLAYIQREFSIDVNAMRLGQMLADLQLAPFHASCPVCGRRVTMPPHDTDWTTEPLCPGCGATAASRTLAGAARRLASGGNILGVDASPILADCLGGLGAYSAATSKQLPESGSFALMVIDDTATNTQITTHADTLTTLLSENGQILIAQRCQTSARTSVGANLPHGDELVRRLANQGLEVHSLGCSDADHGVVACSLWLCHRPTSAA